MRFGSDVVLKQKRTPNGIIIPNEILDEKGGDTQPWVPREVIPPQDQMEQGKAYSVGYSISPTI